MNVMDNGMCDDIVVPLGQPTNEEHHMKYDGTDNAIVAMLEDIESDYQSSEDEKLLASNSNEPEPQEIMQGEEQTVVVAEDRLTFISLTNVFNDKEKSSEYISLPTHRRCAFHTLNLIVKEDVVKNMDLALKKFNDENKKKVGYIRKKPNRSSKASDAIVDYLNMLFVIHNKTRWNSYCDALERVKYFIVKRRTEIKIVFEQF